MTLIGIINFEFYRHTKSKSSVFLKTSDSDIIARIFPDLFPSGRGHPEPVRRNNVSFEKCTEYYLRISSRQFSKHPFFCLIVFYLIPKQRLMSNDYFKLNLTVEDIEKISYVNVEELIYFISKKAEKANGI